MSWWIVDFKSINENGTEGLCNIECDTAASLPAADQTLTAGIKIVRGSKALDLSTGDRYKMNSSGSWVQQPSEYSLDLTGYATQSWVTGELAGYVQTTTYTQEQAAQDAVITAGALRYEDTSIIRLNQLSWTQTSAGAGMWIADAYTASSIDKIVSVLITSFGALKPSEIKTLFAYIPSSVSGMHTVRLVCDQNLSSLSSNPTLYLRVFGYGYQ